MHLLRNYHLLKKFRLKFSNFTLALKEPYLIAQEPVDGSSYVPMLISPLALKEPLATIK